MWNYSSAKMPEKKEIVIKEKGKSCNRTVILKLF
jgi:hypothetical protein